MNKPAIIIENLSKQYRLGEIGTRSLQHDINRWWHRVRGMEDPYLKIGESNDRTTYGTGEYVWALKDIALEVEEGEVLGVIGRNGAGKSTLLKILSKVTNPSTGRIFCKGRIASLLEVGTGFHPDLTGRENIFLNGALMGMKKREVQSKLDEIVAFAGVARYLDTPVKRYSSGMMVRLGFAVAAHLEPEILIVDEVLAVGDAEFQQRAIGKMESVSKATGKTVLFVSHNMASIKQLCTKALVLDKGSINMQGAVIEAIKHYLSLTLQNDITTQKLEDIIDETIDWLDISVRQVDAKTQEILSHLSTRITVVYRIKRRVLGFRLFLSLEDTLGTVICKSFFDENTAMGSEMKAGTYTTHIILPENLLLEGNYIVRIVATITNVGYLAPKDGIIINLAVSETGKLFRKIFEPNFKGLVTLPIEWNTQES